MSFQELLAKVTACPLRPAPLTEVQARLAKLVNQVADPFHTLLMRVALHDTSGVVWKSWALAGTPKLKPGAICLGGLGPFYRFVTVTSDVNWNTEA
jgi:hypothetical protein